MFRLPSRVRVDASTACQLNCPACHMRLKPNNKTGIGMLKFQNFKNLLDENRNIRHVEMTHSGEIFLNPELLDIIKYAYQQEVVLSAYVGTNFNTVSEEMLEALVKYHFYAMNIAIDGASQETYSKSLFTVFYYHFIFAWISSIFRVYCCERAIVIAPMNGEKQGFLSWKIKTVNRL